MNIYKEWNKADVIVGLQIGDEGKGKIVDVLAEKYDVVARYQGGANSGHTIVRDNMEHVFHILPSSMLNDGAIGVLGNGVVIDPVILMREIDSLAEMGISTERLLVSSRAHITLPTHRMMDLVKEKSLGDGLIGSTCRGNTPTYADKYARRGLRVIDVVSDWAKFLEKYRELRAYHLDKYIGYDDVTINSTMTIDGMVFSDYEELWMESAERLRTLQIVEADYTLNEYLDKGKLILLEGAQGSMLDIDFGDYPYLTSSHTISSGGCIGTGIAPNKIGEVFGIFKLYTTRVGAGFYPSEMGQELSEDIRKIGHEYGSTTGRPRRCGWLDLVALKHSIMVNGITSLIMTKADVLDKFKDIKICTDYAHEDGTTGQTYPANANSVTGARYKTFKGWRTPIGGKRLMKELPLELVEVMEFIERYVGVPIDLVSVGRDRDQIIRKRKAS